MPGLRRLDLYLEGREDPVEIRLDIWGLPMHYGTGELGRYLLFTTQDVTSPQDLVGIHPDDVPNLEEVPGQGRYMLTIKRRFCRRPIIEKVEGPIKQVV